jgi:hypothetical protein
MQKSRSELACFDADAFDVAVVDNTVVDTTVVRGAVVDSHVAATIALEIADVHPPFQRPTSSPYLRTTGREINEIESRWCDIRRIASTIFCATGIDPSVVTFAKHRTAQHWGIAEEEVDVMVAARLLEKTASLMAELTWLWIDEPLYAGGQRLTAAA